MNLNSLHKKDFDKSLFGMLVNRLLFRGPFKRPKEAVEAVRAAPKASDELQADYEEMGSTIKMVTEEYNQAYAEDINVDLDNPSAMRQKARDIRTKLEARLPTLSGDQKKALEDQIAFLDEIESALDVYLNQKRDMAIVFPEGRNVNEKYARRTRLRRQYENMQRGKKSMEAWKKRSLFKLIRDHFDQVSAKPEFASFWKTPEGVETNKQVEARQLFMAILAEQTEEFSKPILFGPDFGENYEDNIRNYPFIYNEWAKKQGADPKMIEDEGQKVSQLEAEANTHGSVAEIIARIERDSTDSGVDKSKYNNAPTSPDSKNAAARVEALQNYVDNLEEKAARYREQPGEELKAKNFEGYAEDFRAHLKFEDARYDYAKHRERKEENIDKNFKASYFNTETQQRMAIELAMLKFQKAMETVDHPLGDESDFREHYDPTVRRTLIATIFSGRIGQYKITAGGVETYEENIGHRKSAMLAALARSPYFNREYRGRYLKTVQRKALYLISFGFEAADAVESAKEMKKVIDLCMQARAAKGTSAEAEINAKLSRYPRVYVLKYINDPNLEETSTKLTHDVTQLKTFMKGAMALLEDPMDAGKDRDQLRTKEAKTFLAQVEAGTAAAPLKGAFEGLEKLEVVKKREPAAYSLRMQAIDANYNTQELEHKNDMKIFERFGMKIEASYLLYRQALEQPEFKKLKPPLKYENWDEYLRDPKKFKILADFIEQVIPPAPGGGKEDFMEAFRALYEKGDPKVYLRSPEAGRDHAVTMYLYELLKSHLQLREQVGAGASARQKKIERRDRGVDIGDIVGEHVGNAWEMLTGSGQPITNRIAGGILLYGLYKTGRLAMKGDTPLGKFARIVFVAGAVEIFTKESTGESILDRFGLDPLQDAMEGTYEAVLVQHGKEFMEGAGEEKDPQYVSQREHERALQQMRNVPFYELMEWHDQTGDSGQLIQPKGKRTHKLPKGINANMIIPGTKPNVNKEERACLIIRKAMDNFFTYVGNKDNERGYNYGRNVVRERWYSMIKDSKYQPKYAEPWFQGIADIYRGERRRLTWAIVVEHEIDPHEVERTRQQTLVGQAQEWVGEAWDGFEKWSRQYTNQFEGAAEVFFKELGAGAQTASETVGELIDGGARKLRFAKESIKLWYNEHEYTIKRAGKMHWELVTTGLTLPFKFIWGVDQAVMPFTLSKIKQIEQVLSSRHESAIEQDLQETDIVSNPTFEGSPNVEDNPEYTFFGEYQTPFRKAIEANDNFYADYDRVGYYVSEVDTTGINLAGETYQSNPENVRREMAKKAEQKAIDYFYKKTGRKIPRKLIGEYMYAIHTMNKSSEPPKMYVFYRMPMQGSIELDLIQSGKLADYQDPNYRKDRKMWMLDPSKGKYENFMDAMKIGMDPVRKVVGGVGAYAVQLPRFAFGTIEALGMPIKWIARKFGKTAADKREINEALDVAFKRPENQRQFLDEFFTSAGDVNLSLSQFYKDKTNVALYQFSLAYARKMDRTLYTGLLEGRNNYDCTLYTKHPGGKPFTEMLEYYDKEWSRTKGGRNKNDDVRRAIEEKIRKSGE